MSVAVTTLVAAAATATAVFGNDVGVEDQPLSLRQHLPEADASSMFALPQILASGISDGSSSSSSPVSLFPFAAPNTTQCFLDRFALSRQRTMAVLHDQAEKERLQARYKVDWKNPIGEGAFGSVYKGYNKQTGEPVAVKKIVKKAEGDESFQREMDALLHIRAHGGHPNICGLQANYEQDDHFYLILDLIAGGEMFDHLCNHGPYSEADAARLIREVASALAFLHGLNVVHGGMQLFKSFEYLQ